jgi:hypothetical protein
MIWLLRPDQPKTTEFAPAMDEGTGILPGLPPVAGKPVHLAFDGGLMTSDAGILLLAAVEQRLGIAERLADCIEDPRAPALRQAQEGAAYAGRDDPIPRPADRGGLSRRQ